MLVKCWSSCLFVYVFNTLLQEFYKDILESEDNYVAVKRKAIRKAAGLSNEDKRVTCHNINQPTAKFNPVAS